MTDTPTTISDGWLKREGAADVLDTIANLSNDEVFTPPKLARQVLDLLPDHVWSDSSLKFLDPCCKTGVFLREITKRLMVGLAGEFPCEKERREHILRNQVYGIAITELTALMSRRTVYCASDATRLPNPDFPENCFSAVTFDTPEGNIVFPPAQHDWDKFDVDTTPAKNAKCKICGASANDFAGKDREGMESYAYPFIHMDMKEIWGKEMKFDVIIGNPPYQVSTGGHGAQARPIYHDFVRSAKKLNPQHLTFIIPARWYTGGMGLDSFRSEMLSDENISEIIDFQNSNDCFPGVEVKGGVCIFHRSKHKPQACFIRSVRGDEISDPVLIDISEFDILVRNPKSLPILRKVLQNSHEFVSESVSSVNPFGISTSDKGDIEETSGHYKLFANKTVSTISPEKVIDKHDLLGKFKVLTTKGYGAGEGWPHQIVNKPILAGVNDVCSMTYISVAAFQSEDDAKSFEAYYKTKFFRFLVGIRKVTQDVTSDRFNFVPKVDLSQVWTDEKLYAHFDLTQDEIDFIEATIKEMP